VHRGYHLPPSLVFAHPKRETPAPGRGAGVVRREGRVGQWIISPMRSQRTAVSQENDSTMFRLYE
jgi:hypothetical protein